MQHALVSPSNEITRFDGNVDPAVQTKDGWKWLAVVDEAKPTLRPFETLQKSDLIADGKVVKGWAKTTPDLATLKANLKSLVDGEAESIRLKYITPGVGQAMTYREKLEQAEQVIEDGEDAANALLADDARSQYPTLSASIGVEAATLWQCANLVWQTYQQWAALSHAIEKARLTAKQAIEVAETVDAAYQAHAGAAWPKRPGLALTASPPRHRRQRT